MRPAFPLYFHAALILACGLGTFVDLHGQDAGGFKFLEVKVVDPDGKPMVDVPVEISIGEMNFPMPTDNNGKVAVNVPESEQADLEIRVRHKDYVAMGVAWRGGKKIPESVTVSLTKGIVFGGVVHDEQGRPVKGARVSGAMVFENRHGLINDGKVMPFLDGELATTDIDGRWQCSMAPEGDIEFQLYFSHPEFLDLYDRKFASWQELKRQEKIAVLEKGIVLAGQLLRPDGKPAPQIKLQVVNIEDGDYKVTETQTDADGNFTIKQIRKGPATISVETAEYSPLQKSIEVTTEIKPLLLKLEEGRPIEIKVVNEAGEPLVGSYVAVVDWLYPNRRLVLDENHNTDAKGLWRWKDAPSEMLTYKISALGYRDSKHQLVASDELQTITLKPAIKITGHVIDKHTREPIEKFKLMGLATIDCGLNQQCRIVFGLTDLTTGGDYNFQAGLLCNEFCVSSSSEGYKNATSRTIKPVEDEVQWDFELEQDTNSDTAK